MEKINKWQSTKIKYINEKRLGTKNIKRILLSGIGFFMGQVIFAQYINPVGICYTAAFLSREPFVMAALAALAGMAVKFNQVNFLKYFASYVLLAGANLMIWKKNLKPSPFTKGILSSMAVFLPGICLSFYNGMSLYFFVLAVLESTLAFSITYVFSKGIDAFLNEKRKGRLRDEELISAALIFAAAAAGMVGISFGNVTLLTLVSVLIIYIVSFKGGVGVGCVIGVLSGLVMAVSDSYDPIIIGVMGVFGMAAGLMKEMGKCMTAISGALGCSLIIFYSYRNMMEINFIASYLLGTIIFLLLPQKIFDKLGEYVYMENASNREDYIQRVKDLLNKRLVDFSEAFEKLSQAFFIPTVKNEPPAQKEIAFLIDHIADKACNGCSMREDCWNKNFFNTYQSVFAMLSSCEKKGRIEEINAHFSQKCIYLEDVINVANQTYDIYKIDKVWSNKIAEGRELVSQQLLSISHIISDLSKELDLQFFCNEKLEDMIINELLNYNIEVKNVIVLENKSGKYEVFLHHKPCYGKKECTKGIIPVVSKLLGRKMKKIDTVCNGQSGICAVKMTEEEKYNVAYGISRANKSGSTISGDSYSYMNLKNGKVILALSDGMGSGVKANEESKSAIELFEQFIEAGFDNEIAVKMINSVFVLKSEEDYFTTMDICSVDLYTGIADFVKIGAAKTFLMRNHSVDVITSQTLPVGILKNVDMDAVKVKLKHGDLIVMVTDGILDVPSENWIEDALLTFKSSNPQDISDYILLLAKDYSSHCLKDDMSVLVARIWERIF